MKSFAALLSLSGVSFSQTLLPESPAIWREVTGIKYRDPLAAPALRKPEHQKPHVPSFRTTRDGRVAINPKTSLFTLMMPEKLGGPLLRTPAATKALNSYVMSNQNYFTLFGTSTEDAHKNALFPMSDLITAGKLPFNTTGYVNHVTLFDPTPVDKQTNEITNPKNVGNKDVYTLDVVGAFIHTGTVTPGQMRLWSTKVIVTVSSPKTSAATIEKVERTGSTLVGPAYPFTNSSGLEVSVVDSGRLVLLRLAGGVPNPSLGLPGTWYNIMYSYSTVNSSFIVDPTKWQVLHPISHASRDPRINTRLGFALKHFRDASGAEVPDNVDFGATYPWIDPEAKNLFFTIIGDTLRRQHSYFATMVNGIYTVNPNISNESRYAHIPSVQNQQHTTNKEDFGPTRGVSFVGLWSNGKIITIDNLNNDMDYQIDGNYFSREVSLFSNSPTSIKTQLTMGGGRVNGDGPPGDVDNTGFIDSIQNTFNYNQHAKPTTVRDVVWIMQNPKHTDELAFDDYLDRDALIVANMNGCVMLDANNTLRHQHGFNGQTNVFVPANVKLQNAATPSADRWKLPKWGAVTGPGRLEPAATGGIHGKGFWLNSDIGLRFPVEHQTTSVYLKNWYVGLFIDCRANGERELLTFPDGTSIRITIPVTTPPTQPIPVIKYFDSNGTLRASVTIAAGIGKYGNMIPDPGWAHLAWQIKQGGKEIDFLLNGMLYNRLAYNVNNATLFQMAKDVDRKGGDLIVGNTSPTDSLLGFAGWIDDLKVIARTVDSESACNHAGGTLVGLRPAYPSNGDLRNFNNSFPLHNGRANGLAIDEINLRLRHNGQLTYSAYANLYDYETDRDSQTLALPTDVVSIRQVIHFPEGPIHRTRPRPNSIKNQLCLTCHHGDTNAQGLGLDALRFNSALNAPQDRRRTPLQPLRRVFGNNPAGMVATALPALPLVAPTDGTLIDDHLLKNAATPLVRSFTLIDANTNQEVALLQLGQTAAVSRSAFTTPYKIAVRVNLSSSHGDVVLKLDNVMLPVSTPGGTIPHPSPSGDNIPYATELVGLVSGTHTVSGTPAGGVVQLAHFTLTN